MARGCVLPYFGPPLHSWIWPRSFSSIQNECRYRTGYIDASAGSPNVGGSCSFRGGETAHQVGIVSRFGFPRLSLRHFVVSERFAAELGFVLSDLAVIAAVVMFVVSYLVRTPLIGWRRAVAHSWDFFAPTFLLGCVLVTIFLVLRHQTDSVFAGGPTRVIALIYLGALPTAWSNVGIQDATIRFGVSFTQCVESLKPLFGYVSLVILGIAGFAEIPSLTLLQLIGAALSILGALSAARFGLR